MSESTNEVKSVTLSLQGDSEGRLKITRDQYAVLFAALQINAFFDQVITTQGETIDLTYEAFVEQGESATLEQLETLLTGVADNLARAAEKALIASHVARKIENAIEAIKAEQPIANPEQSL